MYKINMTTLYMKFILLNLSQRSSNLNQNQSLSVVPTYIVYPVFGFCQDKTCCICPVKTVGKVGDFYACFPSVDRSKEFCVMTHWH